MASSTSRGRSYSDIGLANSQLEHELSKLRREHNQNILRAERENREVSSDATSLNAQTTGNFILDDDDTFAVAKPPSFLYGQPFPPQSSRQDGRILGQRRDKELAQLLDEKLTTRQSKPKVSKAKSFSTSHRPVLDSSKRLTRGQSTTERPQESTTPATRTQQKAAARSQPITDTTGPSSVPSPKSRTTRTTKQRSSVAGPESSSLSSVNATGSSVPKSKKAGRK